MKLADGAKERGAQESVSGSAIGSASGGEVESAAIDCRKPEYHLEGIKAMVR